MSISQRAVIALEIGHNTALYNSLSFVTFSLHIAVAACAVVTMQSRSFTNLARASEPEEGSGVKRTSSMRSMPGDAAKQHPQSTLLDPSNDPKAQARHLKPGRPGSFREGGMHIHLWALL